MALETMGFPAIEQRRDQLGVSKQAVAEKLELSWPQANKKLEGKAEFTLAEAMVLAEWWGLCLDELIGRTVPKCPVFRPDFGAGD